MISVGGLLLTNTLTANIYAGINQIRPLIPPQILYEDLPLTDELAEVVEKGRKQAEAIVRVSFIFYLLTHTHNLLTMPREMTTDYS